MNDGTLSYPADATYTLSSNGAAIVFTAQWSANDPPPPLPTPHGYWLVGSDGGIFTFGSAQFYGSTGSLKLQRPVVGIVPTKDDGGYWLDASDGGVFASATPGFTARSPGLGLHPAGSGLPNSLNAPMWAWFPRPTAVAISWWLPTVGSSPSGTPTSPVRAQGSEGALVRRLR